MSKNQTLFLIYLRMRTFKHIHRIPCFWSASSTLHLSDIGPMKTTVYYGRRKTFIRSIQVKHFSVSRKPKFRFLTYSVLYCLMTINLVPYHETSCFVKYRITVRYTSCNFQHHSCLCSMSRAPMNRYSEWYKAVIHISLLIWCPIYSTCASFIPSFINTYFTLLTVYQ